MPKPVIESKGASNPLAIEETVMPELQRMGDAEMQLLRSLKDPLRRIMKGVEDERDSIDDVLEQAGGSKKGSKKQEQKIGSALHEIADRYNADQGFLKDIREVDAKLGQVLALRRQRMERLQGWISELSGTQERLGVKLGENRQEARRGDVAASFQLREIEQELGNIAETLLNEIYPELREGQSQEVISQEELKSLETRIEGILARIQSLLAPSVAPKRVTGPLSKKQERWAEGAFG